MLNLMLTLVLWWIWIWIRIALSCFAVSLTTPVHPSSWIAMSMIVVRSDTIDNWYDDVYESKYGVHCCVSWLPPFPFALCSSLFVHDCHRIWKYNWCYDVSESQYGLHYYVLWFPPPPPPPQPFFTHTHTLSLSLSLFLALVLIFSGQLIRLGPLCPPRGCQGQEE